MQTIEGTGRRRKAVADPDWLTIDDVAGRLSIGRRTLDRLISAGRFPAPDVRVSPKLVRYTSAKYKAGAAALVNGRP